MNPAAQNPLNPPLFEIPNPPDEFGQDGGKFYRCYDALADEIDGDMTKGLKEQLDGMLIFAGLFAGVNSAFLALTIPLLSADPADDTNALLARNNAILLQLLTGRNDTVPPPSLLPSESFSPSHDIYTINALFALSLAFAMISSFLAVIGRQWLVYYRKRGGGGPDRQRWEQLKRSLGAERWRLEPILDDLLPLLLQIGLITFCASLILYLRHLSPSISILVGTPLYVGLAFFVGSALCTVWDRFCPFHSPLSHLLPWAARSLSWMLRIVREGITSKIQSFQEKPPIRIRSSMRWLKRRFSQFDLDWFHSMVESCRDRPLERNRDRAQQLTRQVWLLAAPWFYFLHKGREEESLELLQAIALQRAISISDDPVTVLHSTANILAISNPVAMRRLWEEVTFRQRCSELLRNSDTGMRWLQSYSIDPGEFAHSVRRLYRSAAAHIILTLDTNLDSGHWGYLVSIVFDLSPITSLIPGPLLQDSSSTLIKGGIGAFIINSFLSDAREKKESDDGFLNYLTAYSDVLVGHSDIWNLSLLSWSLLRFQKNRASLSFDEINSIGRLFRKDWEAAVDILECTIITLLQAESTASLDCDRVLTNLLLALEHIVAGDKGSPDMRMMYYFMLLEICETALPSPRLSKAARGAIKSLRVSVAQAWQRRSIADFQDISDPKGNVFDYLGFYLEHKTNPDRTKFAYHENIAVVEAFCPALRRIQTSYLVHLHSQDMREAFGAFNVLVEDIYKITRQLQNKARGLRDPAERWCHWQEEPPSITRITDDSTGVVLVLPSNLVA